MLDEELVAEADATEDEDGAAVDDTFATTEDDRELDEDDDSVDEAAILLELVATRVLVAVGAADDADVIVVGHADRVVLIGIVVFIDVVLLKPVT